MQKEIRRQAELLGFEITNWDIEQIKEKYFHVLVAYGDRTKTIRSVIKKYFAAND